MHHVYRAVRDAEKSASAEAAAARMGTDLCDGARDADLESDETLTYVVVNIIQPTAHFATRLLISNKFLQVVDLRSRVHVELLCVSYKLCSQ